MKIVNFSAVADLVGRRMRVSWEFLLEGTETLAAIPRVLLRRKTRDFEFPPPPQNSPAPFVVYDSVAFPPPGTTVLDLPGWEERDGSNRILTTVESVSQIVGDRTVEVGRRTSSTTTSEVSVPLKRKIEFLDPGDTGKSLSPGTTYYYELFVPSTSQTFRATATATEVYSLGKTMYQMLPEVYRRHDVVSGPTVTGFDGGSPQARAIPEASTAQGQLRRFVDLFGVGFDSMRSTAEELRNLRDIDHVDHQFLPLLGKWIGWDLSFDQTIPMQRHEVKYAAVLYRITGTIPGCMIWARRLTGWPVRVKEFFRNVFFTNAVADKDDPLSTGSRTVDTSNAATLAAIGTFDDSLQYTYDTGTQERDWYAYNVVGIFLRPGTGETVDVVKRKLAKLQAGFGLFLPVNVRGTVIAEMAPQTDVQTGVANLVNKLGETVS